jgi:hypothetical protein
MADLITANYRTVQQRKLAQLVADRERCADRSRLGPLDKEIAEQTNIVAAEMAANSDALRQRLAALRNAGLYDTDDADVIRESLEA